MEKSQFITMAIHGEEFDVEVNYRFYPGEPAKLNGLPEDCYPETPDSIEIDSIMYGQIDMAPQLCEEDLNRLMERLLDSDNSEDGPDEPPEED